MKDEVTAKVNEIKTMISNKEESDKVVAAVSEIVGMFTDKLIEVSERQLKLEEKVEDVFDMLSQIEEEMIENLNNEFEAECPYCGETIPFVIPEEGEDFECPHCGNTIEMELLFDEEGCDCGACGHDHCHGCELEDDDLED
ncbi:MAG: hypothetical protein IJ215_02100 [Clostridia bacterium]|nr:hypothetical protein [Clostridia bacterium]